jgi:hypothetical protein
MTSTLVTAYLPARVTSASSDETYDDFLHGTVEELISLSERLEFPLGAYGTVHPTIEFPELTDELLSDLKSRRMSLPSSFTQFLSIAASVPIPREGIEARSVSGEKVYYEGDQAQRLHKLHIEETFKKRLYDLIIVANIARVGSLEVSRGLMVQDGQQRYVEGTTGAYMLRYAAGHAAKLGWPQLQVLGIAEGWRWAIKQEGFLEGFGGGPTSRALNAFTHLLGPNVDFASLLLWTLIGLEAVYTKGQGALQEQVREKSQLLLGKQEAFKKKVGQMYNFRSRFVHGELDFVGRRAPRDVREKYRKHYIELFECTYLAEAILIATFQQLIQRQWRGVQFTSTYTINELSE